MCPISADREIYELIGVYNAEGTVRGELTYWIGARLGRAHCALCDITHGLARERADWKQLRDRLPVPFAAFHRNDQPDDVRATTDDVAPVVVARTSDDSLIVLLGPDELEACDGSTEGFRQAIETANARVGVRWP